MIFTSSTRDIPQVLEVPRHIAIIMDGNGRWAKKRFLPRVAGHKRGVDALRNTVKACIERGVEFLTVFAFSTENWRRPEDEVSFLMKLFISVLEYEIDRFNENGVKLKVVGDLSRFEPKLVDAIARGEAATSGNNKLTLTVAANYGGRWDIVQAVNRLVQENPQRAGRYDEADLARYLTLADAPEPDLFIRTGGEERISNFLLWQLAYTEFYFTDELWPAFGAASLDAAINSYRDRERRFGRTSQQLASRPAASDDA